MEEVSGWFEFLGPALVLCALGVIREHRNNMRLIASGDENAREKLGRWRTTEALLGPVLIVIGVCMTLVTFYADYREASSSPAADHTFETLVKALPK